MSKRPLSFISILSSAIFLLLIVACAPVLRKDLMQAGIRDFSLEQLRGSPLQYEGKLFILGGTIVKTRNIEKGSVIEAIYIPVDSLGYPKGREYSDGRFLALFPRSAGYLEPEIYAKGREISIAGVFTGVERGKIDEADYTYPVFEIKQVTLLAEERQRYMSYPSHYPYGPYSPFYYPPYAAPGYPYWWNDPFWRSRVPPWWW